MLHNRNIVESNRVINIMKTISSHVVNFLLKTARRVVDFITDLLCKKRKISPENIAACNERERTSLLA